MTLQFAKQYLEESKQLSDELQMRVYTLFQRDMITNEIHCMRTIFSDRVEANIWEQRKQRDLIKLDVPYALYLDDILISSQNNINFE